MTFGERVRELRKKKKLSQNALAVLAEVSPRTIFGYEAGTTYPRTESMLNRLADALGVSRAVLLNEAPSSASLKFDLPTQPQYAEMQMLTQQVVSILLDDHLPDQKKDDMVRAIMDAYWESRRRSQVKNDTTT